MAAELLVGSRKGRLVLAAAILASGMAFLDGTVVNIALPRIQEELGSALSGVQWVIDAYALAIAALILISGSLGDRFGRRRVFMAGIGIFIIGSLFCAGSASTIQLIVSRALQGVGGALMIPGSLAIINTTFSQNNRGYAIGLWASLAGAIATMGPLVGGAFVQWLDWEAVFLINIPLGLAALYLTNRYVPESSNPEARRIDWLGIVLITAGLFGISFGLIQGAEWGWGSPVVIVALAGGALLLPVFVVYQARSATPLVPLEMFRNPLISGANLSTFLLYFALNGVSLFVVLNFLQIQNYSPLEAGLGLLPTIVLITLLTGRFGRLADRIGARTPMILGPAIGSLGLAWLSMAGTSAGYFAEFLPGLTLFGLGMSVVIAPLTKSAMSVDQGISGIASGLNNAVSRVAALMAVAVLGVVIVSLFTIKLDDLLAETSMPAAARAQIMAQSDRLGAIVVPPTFPSRWGEAAQKAIGEAFTFGFRWIMVMSSLLALLSSAVAALWIPRYESS